MKTTFCFSEKHYLSLKELTTSWHWLFSSLDPAPWILEVSDICSSLPPCLHTSLFCHMFISVRNLYCLFPETIIPKNFMSLQNLLEKVVYIGKCSIPLVWSLLPSIWLYSCVLPLTTSLFLCRRKHYLFPFPVQNNFCSYS